MVEQDDLTAVVGLGKCILVEHNNKVKHDSTNTFYTVALQCLISVSIISGAVACCFFIQVWKGLFAVQ